MEWRQRKGIDREISGSEGLAILFSFSKRRVFFNFVNVIGLFAEYVNMSTCQPREGTKTQVFTPRRNKLH